MFDLRLAADNILWHLNETELLALARRQGLGILKRGLGREVLVGLVSGELGMKSEYVSGTSETRIMLEKYIFQNYAITRSQLPGCNGHCPTYNCSEGRHAMCFSPAAGEIR